MEAETGGQGEVHGGVSTRAAPWVAWSLCATSLLALALALLLISLGSSEPLPKGFSPWQERAIEAIGLVGAPVLGGLISSRRPRNPYGWLWCVVGLGLALAFFGASYAAYSAVDPKALPAPETVVGALEMGWVVAVIVLPFVLLLFPDGRLPSRRWRFLAWTVVAVGAFVLILGPFRAENDAGSVNPFAASGPVGKAIVLVTDAGIVVLFLAAFLSVLSLVFRYRRARGLQRQQIKWFAFAAIVFGSGFPMDLLGLDRLLGDTFWSLFSSVTMIGLYAAVGVAILRYRLYDIDVVINRTLVYGSLSAMLLGVYFGGVTATQALLRNLTDQEQLPQLVVVGSTLVIAAIFNPLRRRIQYFIDRSFYRKKYDARKTLEAFSAKLRDETDLEALRGDLVGVVRETMQPTHVSLWLRPVADVGSGWESPG